MYLKKQIKKYSKIVGCVLLFVIIAFFGYNHIKNKDNYHKGIESFESGENLDALKYFSQSNGYNDSNKRMKKILKKEVISKKYISIDNALKYLKYYSENNKDLYDLCKQIKAVENNVYYQDHEYKFEATYFLSYGKPMAKVTYENYLGYFVDSEVKSVKKDFLFKINAKGYYRRLDKWSNIYIYVNKHKVYVDFEGNDYYLDCDK